MNFRSLRPDAGEVFITNLGVTGGLRSIFEHANWLTRFGHQVLILSPYCLFPKHWGAGREIVKPPLRWLKDQFYRVRGQKRITWFDLIADWRRISSPSLRHIPDGDIVVAGTSVAGDWIAT